MSNFRRRKIVTCLCFGTCGTVDTKVTKEVSVHPTKTLHNIICPQIAKHYEVNVECSGHVHRVSPEAFLSDSKVKIRFGG
jgi:hypothetical protein